MLFGLFINWWIFLDTLLKISDNEEVIKATIQQISSLLNLLRMIVNKNAKTFSGILFLFKRVTIKIPISTWIKKKIKGNPFYNECIHVCVSYMCTCIVITYTCSYTHIQDTYMVFFPYALVNRHSTYQCLFEVGWDIEVD